MVALAVLDMTVYNRLTHMACIIHHKMDKLLTKQNAASPGQCTSI
jgi:hypothetical protein